MARLHEHQGKALLAQHGIAVPRGVVARSPDEAAHAAQQIGGRVVLKAQAWITGRAAKGGVVFAESPQQAAEAAEKLLGLRFGNFPVTEILVEEAIDIRDEIFVSLTIDDSAKAPVLLLDPHGGSGIEERAGSVTRLPVDVRRGVDPDEVRRTLAPSPIDPPLHAAVADAVTRAVEVARRCDARSLEINPLVTTPDRRILAADCRIAIDDYAVFRHPELGIEIARELDHPPTELERIAYRVEQADHRGTFYFAQLPVDVEAARDRLIGFHGAGGGGSMMSMDAVASAGFVAANFCDTSGNPSAAKVYRAARIILTQPEIVGYFGSGSGVASQEQFWSAYGLAKAFIEMNLSIPAVVRLGGNSEDRAVEILEDACRGLPGPVEGYRKDDPPAKCAARFAERVKDAGARPHAMSRRVPEFVGAAGAYRFALSSGEVWIDHGACDEVATETAVRHSSGLLKNEGGRPVLAVDENDIAGKDSEMIACEIECRRAGCPVLFVNLPVAGLDEPAAAQEPALTTERRYPMDIRFTITQRIGRPIEEVFDAIVDPEKLCRYFTSSSSGPLEAGRTVRWSWAGGIEDDTEVVEVVPNQRIVCRWKAYQVDDVTTCTFAFAADADGWTTLRISEEGWTPGHAGVASALEHCAGWQHFALCLKAWIEHGIDLRVTEQVPAAPSPTRPPV